MSCAEIVTSIGLTFDIAGVALIWRYGIPNKYPGGAEAIIDEGDPEDSLSETSRKVLEQLGLVTLIIGFTLQLVGTLLQ